MPPTAGRPAEEIAHAEVLDACVTVLVAVIDMKGQIVYVNAASRFLLGYDPVELVGLPGDHLIPPGLVAEARRAFERARAGGPRLSQRILARRSDGSHAQLHVDLTPLSGEETGIAGVVAIGHEIDVNAPPLARARAESRSPGPTERLMEGLPAVVYVAEPGEAGRWRYVSPHIERMLGYSPGEWLAKPGLWADRLHPDDRQRVLDEENRDVAGDSTLVTEYRMLTRDGSVIWVRDEAVLHLERDGGRYYDGLLTDITERKHFEARLQYIADHDSLTGLCNRRRFSAELEVELKRRRRHEQPATLVMVDLDGLKDVNDLLGHHVGDELLRATAVAMRRRLRESDTVCRLGGDEFAALLRGTDEQGAVVVATELLQDIAVEAGRFAPGLGRRSASAGVAELRGDDRSPDQVLGRADRAMYEAKRGGGSRVEVDPVATD